MLSSICLKTPNQVGVDIEESLERILTTLYLGETTDRNLVQKWVSKSFCRNAKLFVQLHRKKRG